MNIKLHKPHSISETGKRINNEDSIFPGDENGTGDDRLFIVCDGVGGSNKGEIASALACESIHAYFKTFLEGETPFDPEFIDNAVRYAEIRFDEHIADNQASKGMATTLCLLYFTEEGAYVAHAGDSRVYQFRGDKIVYQTDDHTLVNAWVKSGKIKAEEASVHPQKNVIYKAIQSTKIPVEADVDLLTDIEPGDVFLLCTDGVTEALTDEELTKIFAGKGNAEEKSEIIREICRQKSHDNYSAYIIPVKEVYKESIIKQVLTTLFSFI